MSRTDDDTAVPPRKPGRPRLPDARREWVRVRCTEEEQRDIRKRAEAAGLSETDYVRSLLWP